MAEESRLDGSGLVQDATNLVSQFSRGDWAEGLISSASSVLEVGELLKDPIAKLASMGLGWLIEFVEPLQWVLDKLVGDQEQIDRLSQTWTEIAGELQLTGDELDKYYKTDTANWSGPGVTQYLKYCHDHVELYHAAAGAATVTAGLIEKCGIILKVVRTIVRQLFTDCVGKVISIALRYPPPMTPAALPDVVNTIADTGTGITKWINQLKRAFSNAGEMLKNSKTMYASIKKTLSNFSQDAAKIADPLRAVNYLSKNVETLATDVALSARNFVGHAAKEGVSALPEKIITESAKEVGMQVAAGGSDGGSSEAVALYDGPGPHRVSGTLEEPS